MLSQKAKKGFKIGLVKGIIVFLKKKKNKRQYPREHYRNLSEEEKNKKRQYGCKRYKYLSLKVKNKG